jgi:hypothetical protein
LFFAPLLAGAQGLLKFEKDSIPLFRGFAVSFDMVGFVQMQLSDYGQYEGALRLNLHDQYFPTFEIGLGRANHKDDEVTGLSYKTAAPYFRLGVDANIMKKKHTGNRVFVGLRYAYTNYKADITRQTFPDPVWKWPTTFRATDLSCYQHWAEILFGIDAKVFGPFHLGWSARYRVRVSHNDSYVGKTWYVPGYGTQDSSALGATFNVIIDI